jgi:hypothetical protein
LTFIRGSELNCLLSRWKNGEISLEDFQKEIDGIFAKDSKTRQEKEAKRIDPKTGIEEQLSLIEEISIIDNRWAFFARDLEEIPELRVIFEVVQSNYYDMIGLCTEPGNIRYQSPTIESGTLFTPQSFNVFPDGLRR